MRAIVLLCLLHAAFADSVYDWEEPGVSDTIPHLNAGNACGEDQGSCGCCLMLQGLNRLKTYFNTTLSNLQQEYEKTKQHLDIIEDNRTAFSVALFDEDRFQCYGPFQDGIRRVMYKHVFFNLGNGYNVETGVFTAQYSGVYTLTVAVYSDAGSSLTMLAACAILQINNQAIVGSREINFEDQEDAATMIVIHFLNAGDTVDVILPIGCFLCDDNSHYNTFSAFLLYLAE